MRLIFLCNNQPMPFYKWVFRSMKSLPVLSDLSSSLSYLMNHGNSPQEAEKKKALIEQMNHQVICFLQEQGLTESDSFELEIQAYQVQKGIQEPSIRNCSILDAVET